MKCFFVALFAFTFFICIGCDNGQEVTIEQTPVTENKEPTFDCFYKIDTIMGRSSYTKACHNTAYQQINDRYVLAISYNTPTLYDRCLHIVINESDSVQPAQLLIYEEGKANILSFCDDYGSYSPIRTLTKATGDIYIRFSRPDTAKNSAPHNFRVSIWVNELRFGDPVTKGATSVSRVPFLNVPNWTWYAG